MIEMGQKGRELGESKHGYFMLLHTLINGIQ
jgi:hypothetical protein